MSRDVASRRNDPPQALSAARELDLARVAVELTRYLPGLSADSADAWAERVCGWPAEEVPGWAGSKGYTLAEVSAAAAAYGDDLRGFPERSALRARLRAGRRRRIDAIEHEMRQRRAVASLPAESVSGRAERADDNAARARAIVDALTGAITERSRSAGLGSRDPHARLRDEVRRGANRGAR